VVATLPAFAGLVAWLRSCSPARLYGADQMTAGRLTAPAAASILHGAAFGVLMAVATFGIGALLPRTGGYVPSLSTEIDIVNSPSLTRAGAWIAGSFAVALAIALLVETAGRIARIRRWDWIVVTLVAGVAAASFQRHEPPATFLALADGVAAAGLLALVYRWRGFGAAWVAALTMMLLSDLVVAQALGNADTRAYANLLRIIALAILAVGVWGYAAAPIQRQLKTLTSH